MSAARRVAEHLLAQRLARTAGRWPRSIFGQVDENAARLARAEELGFDTSRIYYHGTKSDFPANDFAGIWDEAPEGGNVVPIFIRKGRFKPTIGNEGRVVDPRDVRSIFARFDPSKADSAELLAGLAAGLPVSAVTLREALRSRVGDGA